MAYFPTLQYDPAAHATGPVQPVPPPECIVRQYLRINYESLRISILTLPVETLDIGIPGNDGGCRIACSVSYWYESRKPLSRTLSSRRASLTQGCGYEKAQREECVDHDAWIVQQISIGSRKEWPYVKPFGGVYPSSYTQYRKEGPSCSSKYP